MGVVAAVLAASAALTGCGGSEPAARTQDASRCTPSGPERVEQTTENPDGVIRDDAPVTGPDTDGDGVADGVETDGGQVALVRAGGNVLRFGSADGEVALQTSADFDADGRDDLVLTVAGRDPATYVVAGRASPGTLSPADDGVRIRPELAHPLPELAGERGADFAVVVRGADESHTDVYDGAAVLGLGPGADGRALKPTTTLVGLPRVRLPLSQGAEPEMLLYVPGDPAEVRFVARPKAIYRASLGTSSRVEDLFVFDEAGGRKIGLRIGERLAVWPVPPTCA